MAEWACAVARFVDFAAIRSPYDPGFVDDLKEYIPAGFRRWDREERVWLVKEPYVNDALDICNEYGQVTLIDQRVPVDVSSARDQEWAEAMFAAVPEHLRRPAYRALVKVLHPDQGGDKDVFTALQLAYERLNL